MMVETILESSQDFGMSNGSLPQWKRELLQRRLSRTRPPPAPAPPPPPPAAPPDEDEELRYGPGIVKRLKSRYLSLALRDAPRRRPSVLRRAASLEHLLDERPPPAPRAPRPVSLAPPPPPPSHARRDSVKRARSVDALSRLDDRDREHVAPGGASPERERPPVLRAARPPRRPQPLLRETERPPPDVVRSTLRKFESAPSRRPALALALRDPSPPPAPPTPPPPPPAPIAPPPSHFAPPPPPLLEPEPPSPPSSPAPKSESQIVPSPIASPSPETGPAPKISSIARPPLPPDGTPTAEAPSFDEADDSSTRAGSRGRYAFSATNPVLAPRPLRRVGVIRPMPAAPLPPPSCPSPPAPAPVPERTALVNGHSTPEMGPRSRIGAAGIERAWSGSAVKRLESSPSPSPLRESQSPERKPSWLRGAGSRPRAPPPASTSIVFNFSDRKDVPDYIENDGIILRANRRNRIKAGEPGVVLLEGRRGADAEAEELEAEAEERAPSPCDVRFVNDNVLINGKSSMPTKPNKDRIAKLKLQFDDTLTRTFEYPSETSLCEECPAPAAASTCPASPDPSPCPSPSPAPQHVDHSASLADNTHIASAALSRYTPSKTRAAAFALGLTNPHPQPDPHPHPPHTPGAVNGCGGSAQAEGGQAEEGEAEEAARGACGAGVPRSWSDARAHRTDLLF